MNLVDQIKERNQYENGKTKPDQCPHCRYFEVEYRKLVDKVMELQWKLEKAEQQLSLPQPEQVK